MRDGRPSASRCVLQCRTHGRAFTLYPLGHIPYGRLAIAPVGLDGQVLFPTEREPQASGKRAPVWRTTQFGPAFAAIHDPTVKLTDRRWWATQTPERLAQSARLLGVHPIPVQEAERSRSGSRSTAVLRQAEDEYAGARAPPPGPGDGRRFGPARRRKRACSIACGSGVCAGCWRTVTRWDVASRGARGRVFRVAAHPPDERRRRARRYEFDLVRRRTGLRRRARRGEDRWPIEKTTRTPLQPRPRAVRYKIVSAVKARELCG